jgi:hypothetical protein
VSGRASSWRAWASKEGGGALWGEHWGA